MQCRGMNYATLTSIVLLVALFCLLNSLYGNEEHAAILSAQRVHVDFYGEALCPFCRNFTLDTLNSMFADGLDDLMVLRYVRMLAGAAGRSKNLIILQVLWSSMLRWLDASGYQVSMYNNAVRCCKIAACRCWRLSSFLGYAKYMHFSTPAKFATVLAVVTIAVKGN